MIEEVARVLAQVLRDLALVAGLIGPRGGHVVGMPFKVAGPADFELFSASAANRCHRPSHEHRQPLGALSILS